MLKLNALQPSDVSIFRVGILMLLIGLISLAQAAGLFPLGSSDYPVALTLIAFGGAFVLTDLGKRIEVVKYIQVALMLLAIALVIIF